MKRETTLIILGILVMITPFLGLPWAWKSYILVLIGIGIALLALMLRYSARKRALENGRATDTFEESGYKQKHEKIQDSNE